MKYTLYQIQSEYDTRHEIYSTFEEVTRNHSRSFPCGIYEKVYEGETSQVDLDQFVSEFNTRTEKPQYLGRTIATSDIVYLHEDSPNYSQGAYYCDDIGWKALGSVFNPYEAKPEKISCILLEPNEMAKEIRISPTLENLQNVCQGNIECVHFFPEEDLLLICNESGKIMNLPPCRAIMDHEDIADVIAGPFLIVQEDPMGEFINMDSTLKDTYMDKYRYPERVYVKNHTIHVDPIFEPTQERKLER